MEIDSDNGKKVCFVCCKRVHLQDESLVSKHKEIVGDDGEGSQPPSFRSSSSETYLEFVDFAQRYLKLDTNEVDRYHDGSTKVEVFCESCLFQVKQIFGLYEQFCQMEHRLSSKIVELGKLMKESFEHGGTKDKEEAGIRKLIATKCLEKILQSDGGDGGGKLSSTEEKGFYGDDSDDDDYIPIDVDVKIVEGDSADEVVAIEIPDETKAADESADEEEVELAREESPMVQAGDPLSSPPKTFSNVIYVENSDEDSDIVYVPEDTQSESDDTDDDDAASSRGSFPEPHSEISEYNDTDGDDVNDDGEMERHSNKNSVADSQSECNDTDDDVNQPGNTPRKRIVLSEVVKLMSNQVNQENKLLESQAPKEHEASISNLDQLNFSPATSNLWAAKGKDSVKDAAPDKVLSGNLVCDHCHRHFETAQGVYTHLLSHESQSEEQGRPCPFCYKKFTLAQTQKLHMDIHHPSITSLDKPFTCDGKRCTSSFKTISELNNHIGKHSEDILLECSVCQWGFIDPHHLQVHEIIHTEPKNGVFHCPGCKGGFQRVKELQIHFNFKHGSNIGLQLVNTELQVEKPKIVSNNKCRYCKEDIPIEEDMTLHSQKCAINPQNIIPVTTANGSIVKKVRCHKCDKWISQVTIKNHLILHLFKEKIENDRQAEESSGDEEKEKEPEIISTSNYTCNQCQREFPQALGLHTHLLWHDKHSGEQGTPCCFCYKTIVLSQTKLVHMQVQHPSVFNTEKPFGCDENGCEASFKTMPELNEHVATHSKPISSCSFCNWGFLDPNRRKLHELIHIKRNKSGNYECPDCQCKFSRMKELQNHFDFRHGSVLAIEVYRCSRCPKYFRTNSVLRTHMQMKHKSKRSGKKHQCLHCKVGFRLEQTLTTHLKTCTKNPDNFIRAKTQTGVNRKKFRCSQCGIFVFQHSMRSHMLTHMDETDKEKIKVTCETCGNSYSSFSQLSNHINKVHKNIPAKTHACEFCGITYKRRESLKRHVDTFHKEIDSKVVCSLCGKVLASNASLSVHMQTHKALKKYGCHLCELKYTNKFSLKCHLVKKHGKKVGEEFTPGEDPSLFQQNNGEKIEQSEETPWQCDTCGIFCDSEAILKGHIRILHRKSKQRVVCQFCGKSYSGQWILNEHIDVVHKNVNLKVVCEVCGKVFPTTRLLKGHMKIHGEKKRFACHLCEGTLSSQRDLRKHLVKMHGKNKGEEFTPGEGIMLKSACLFPSCVAKFETDVELQQHVDRNHTPVASSKFLCNLCGKVFANQGRLTRHNLVHSKEKPHNCHVCGQTFAYKGSLKDHLLVKHSTGEGQPYYQCEQPGCEAKFKLLQRLNKHVRRIHGVGKEVMDLKNESVSY